jgi:hypothetical protein
VGKICGSCKKWGRCICKLEGMIIKSYMIKDYLLIEHQ